MIYVFGDLRQLRSFELDRPPISPPRRLRPLRNNTVPIRAPPEPEQWLVPITRPPIPPKPAHDPEKPPPSLRPLPPIPEPVSPSSPNTGLQVDTPNPRVTLSSVCSGSFTSCDGDPSRTSTTSSDEVEIHISEVFYDIEPHYLHDDSMTSSSPVPSSWQGESPPHTLTPWTPHRLSYNTASALPAGPGPRKFLPPVDSVFRDSNARTSTTSDGEQEKWIPTAGFIRPFEYNQWEEWDSESGMFTNDGSLGGYGAGDEESRISYFVRPTSLRQGASNVMGTTVPPRFRVASRRGTIASSRISQELGAFDFDALPAFQAPAPHAVAPPLQRRPRYRTCDASPPPPPQDETSLTEAGRQGGVMRTWFVELPKLLIRRMQGKCGAAKQAIKDILSRSASEALRRNGGGEYRDAPETQDRKECLPIQGGLSGPTITVMPQPLSQSHSTVPEAREKGKVKENWRVRWKRALSVPAFRSPLTKILSPVVTRAQWEVTVRAGALAFVTSFVLVAVLVAVPVP